MRTFHRLAVVACALAGSLSLSPAVASAADPFFSEYVEGSSNNKALEIYNGTGAPLDLGKQGFKVEMFFNGATTPGTTINLSGTVANRDVFVLAHASANAAILAQADQTNGSSWFNGDDAVVLSHGSTVVDAIGQVGFDPGSEWGTGLTSTADNTLRRKAVVTQGDADRSDAFVPANQWDGYATDTFDGLGSHTVAGDNAPVVATCGTASLLEGRGGTATVTARDGDGVVTEIAGGTPSPAPSPGGIARTSLTPAAGPGETASATFTVDPSTPAGTYKVPITATNADAQPQQGTCTLTVDIQPILPIGSVQGSVPDDANGATFASPYAGKNVVVQGVVTERTLSKTSSGGDSRGFFLQNTPQQADADPASSDGIFVFTSSFTDLIGGYTPHVGDEIVVRGRVSEFFGLTELSSARGLEVVREGVDIAPFTAEPPADVAGADRYWERHEGMQAVLPAGSQTLGGRDVFASTADAELWFMRPDSPVAGRDAVFARRVFRDPHPLDDLAVPLWDNGNGYRVLLGSLGIKAATEDRDALIAPGRTFQPLTAPAQGAVYYAFSKYSIQPSAQIALGAGPDPAGNAPPPPPVRSHEYEVATFNLENLYDFRDDPTDGCDFAGNSGCPGVRPPFDYVPASAQAYEQRLGQEAQQIVEALHAPEVLMVQEAEDQDICTPVAGALACGAGLGDGHPDVLQDLALQVAARGGPSYEAVLDRDGADDRGIVSGFLYRTDRVELLPARADDAVLGADPQVDYRAAGLPYNSDVSNPKALNAELPADVDRSTGVDGDAVYTRAPQVARFRVWRKAVGEGNAVELTAISNHFSSTPDARVGQRREQAAYGAALVRALSAGPQGRRERVVVGGDLNVFPRPDDPFAPGDSRFPSDQLGPLYAAGLTNLYDVLVAEAPQAAYTYVFNGQAQTLDQLFVTPQLHDELRGVRVAHVNADFPADEEGDGPRGTSDHDPPVARFGFSEGVTPPGRAG